jgi:hypothetical protein
MSKHLTNSNGTTEFRTNSQSLSDEALDSVVGGLNPQPLPPRIFDYYSYSAFSAVQAAAAARFIFG